MSPVLVARASTFVAVEAPDGRKENHERLVGREPFLGDGQLWDDALAGDEQILSEVAEVERHEHCGRSEKKPTSFSKWYAQKHHGYKFRLPLTEGDKPVAVAADKNTEEHVSKKARVERSWAQRTASRPR